MRNSDVTQRYSHDEGPFGTTGTARSEYADPDRPWRKAEEPTEEKRTEAQYLDMARNIVSHAETSPLATRKSAWIKAHKAINGEHAEGSRYLRKDYGSARSSLFVPKTRSAVRKNQTAAANALFSTDDVVTITAGTDADPRAVASAEIKKELLSYRLDRTNHKAGIPWFLIAMGAHHDAQVTGVCVSKQFWEYQEAAAPALEDGSMLDAQGAMVPLGDNVVGLDGLPAMAPKPRVIRDRPMIESIMPENCIMDSAAPWHDVVQGGAFWIVQYPMHVSTVRALMKRGSQRMGGGAWREIPEKVIGQAVQDYNKAGVRTARGRGTDRLSSQNQPKGVNDFDIVWVHENFIQVDGEDMHFWSLGTRDLLSDARPTIESYPAHRGERPYVMGVAAIEPHNILPMSPVEAIQPIQSEINDLRNLRMDTMRQAVSPIAIVRRGNKVDLKTLHYRGPDATILVNEKDDITFDRAPPPDASAFQEAAHLNADMDELSGSFSTSAVQTNRQLNETVGGMSLMSGSANAQTEFDLRVWVETWVEPVLRQLIWLEERYETDATLLAIAGEKSKAFQRYGMGEDDIEDLLDRQVTVKVSVGIGAADPMQRLQKFGGALELIMGMAEKGAFEGQAMPKAEEIIGEVFGLAGYSTAERFFEFKSLEELEGQKGPSPEEQEAMMKIELEQAKAELQANLAQEKASIEADKAAQQIAMKEREGAMKMRELEAKIAMQAEQAAIKIREMEMKLALQQDELLMRREDRAIEQAFSREDRELQREAQYEDHEFQRAAKHEDFALERERAGLQHDTARKQLDLKAEGMDRDAEHKDRLREAKEAESGAKPAAKGKAKSAPARASDRIGKLEGGVSELQNGLAALAQAMTQLAKAQSAPKQIVRDAQGRVTGVTTKGT